MLEADNLSGESRKGCALSSQSLCHMWKSVETWGTVGGGGVRMSPGAMVGDIFLYDLDLSRNIKVRDALGSDQFYVCFL